MRAATATPLFLHQLRSEQLLFWRSREAAVFVFLFPVLLFLLLATVYEGTYRGHPLSDYLVAALLGYGTANTAFGGLAITLVLRRESGHYPEVLRALAEILPLKHLIDAVIGIYLDHESIWQQSWALAIVAAWGVLGAAVAARRFRWEPRER